SASRSRWRMRRIFGSSSTTRTRGIRHLRRRLSLMLVWPDSTDELNPVKERADLPLAERERAIMARARPGCDADLEEGDQGDSKVALDRVPGRPVGSGGRV